MVLPERVALTIQEVLSEERRLEASLPVALNTVPLSTVTVITSPSVTDGRSTSRIGNTETTLGVYDPEAYGVLDLTIFERVKGVPATLDRTSTACVPLRVKEATPVSARFAVSKRPVRVDPLSA